MEESMQLMNKLTRQVEALDYQEILTTAEESLGLKEFKIAQLPPEVANELYHSVCEK